MSLIAQGRAPTWSQAGLSRRRSRGRFEVNPEPVTRQKVHGWKCPNRGYRRLQRGGGGRLLPIPGGAYIAVFAMCAMTVPTTCTAIRRARFGAPVRQNNQNSQNEPGMSFGINETLSRKVGACRRAFTALPREHRKGGSRRSMISRFCKGAVCDRRDDA